MCSVFWTNVCHSVLLLLTIVLTVLRFTASVYHFGIFNLLSEAINNLEVSVSKTTK